MHVLMRARSHVSPRTTERRARPRASVRRAAARCRAIDPRLRARYRPLMLTRDPRPELIFSPEIVTLRPLPTPFSINTLNATVPTCVTFDQSAFLQRTLLAFCVSASLSNSKYRSVTPLKLNFSSL
ncbi:unnamed protein product [Pieris brassicae]|uniref:Uncharacterized protein n=1 Tax=Pieris brassicae TaxID=7116 RepID=A0A9P0TT88_PIEBR|nr:unnamed protein product [Pieris brassicae]